MPIRFSTPMIQCNKMGDGYACMALLPAKKIPGDVVLELQAIPSRSSRKIESIFIHDASIEASSFQIHRHASLKCRIDSSKDLYCE